MGTKYKFTCSRCDFSSMVSGKKDVGFNIENETMFCKACNDLVDVVTKIRGSDDQVSEYDQAKLGKCSMCLGTDLDFWTTGQPCPICGGKMIKDKKSTLFWD